MDISRIARRTGLVREKRAAHAVRGMRAVHEVDAAQGEVPKGANRKRGWPKQWPDK